MQTSSLKVHADDLFQVLGSCMQAGCWAINLCTNDVWLSDEFLELLGLKNTPGCLSPDALLAQLVHTADKRKLQILICNCKANINQPQKKEVRLLQANGCYNWYQIFASARPAQLHKPEMIVGGIINIEVQKSKDDLLIEINNKIAARDFFFDETSKMGKVGGWEVDLEKNTLFWSEQTKRIHQVNYDYQPTVEKAANFFCGASKDVMLEKFNRLVNYGEPYDEQLEFITALKRKMWVRAVGKPLMNEAGKVIAARGVFQDIDEQKKRELALEASLLLINKQNDKLKDFAYIVSHNLRSHTGNLKMIASMIDYETEPEMKLEWLEHIKGLSDSLDETVNNLREIANSAVSIQENIKHIAFRDVYHHVVNVLPFKTKDENAKLNADFSECEYIDYVPAYLESILLNLMTNAIKYKHPRRHPEIFIKSYFEDSRPCLEVADNGLGIDLKTNGHKLFKMNETFHNNADARGIGLYITKNQIEKLGGGIEVNSEVNKGTTFKIKF